MAFTKIAAAGIGSTETVTVDGLTVINNGSFGGNLSVGGTLTYEDVTNVDSVGLITARSGINVGSGITLSPDGNIFATGLSTYSGLADFNNGINVLSNVTISDSIVHDGNTDTKIRFPEGNTISAEINGSEALRVGAGGSVGIGTNAPDTILHLQASDGTAKLITFNGGNSKRNNYIGITGSDNLEIGVDENNEGSGSTLRLRIDGGEKARITSGGALLVGHDSSTGSGKLQTFTAGQDGIDIIGYNSTAANGGRLTFYRSKNATIGSNTEVADNDSLGRIDWRGYNDDGTAYNIGATIEAEVDGAIDSTTDMPSALVFKTSADGSSSPTERARIDSSGNFGINVSTPQKLLDVRGEFAISNSNSSYWDFDRDDSDGSLKIKDTGTERLRILSNGNVVLNHTDSRTYNGHDPKLSIQGTTYSQSTFSITNNTNDNAGAYIFFAKQRSGSAGGSTVVQSGDLVGQLRFLAGDGTDLESEVANITVSMDGTPGGNDVPGKITFATTNDGGNTSTERMRIHQTGAVSINTTTSYGRLHVKESSFNPNTSTWLTNAAYVASNSFGGGYCLLDGSKGYSMYCHGSGANFSIQHHTSTTATASGGVQLTNGATSFSGMSDERDKENLVKISDAITKIKTLRTVIGNYIWQPDVKHAFLIAQDVQAVLPEAVDIMNTYEETEKQRLGLRYTEVIPLLTAALQEAITEIESLKSRLDTAGL